MGWPKLYGQPIKTVELDLGLHAGQVRDLSNKKYKMGGLFRVEMAQELEMEVALELASRAFASNRNIGTWNLLRIRR
jgi:hypothetical protein